MTRSEYDDDDLDIGIGGEFTPYLKFNAKTKEWTWNDEAGPEELTRPKFAIDLANITLGWLRLEEGSAPDWVLDPARGQRAPRPSDRHKRAFLVRVEGRDGFEGAGEFSSAAIGVGAAVRTLYQEYRSKAEDHPDRIPVVEVTGYTSAKGRFGTNFAPSFRITGWAKRSAEMPDEMIRPNGADRHGAQEEEEEDWAPVASRRAKQRRRTLDDDE